MITGARLAEIEALYAKAKKIGWANDEAFLVHLNSALPELLRLARLGRAVEALPILDARYIDTVDYLDCIGYYGENGGPGLCVRIVPVREG